MSSSIMPALISIFCPGSNAGNPDKRRSWSTQSRLYFHNPPRLTQIRTARASESIAEVAVSTAAGSLRSSGSCSEQSRLFILINLHCLSTFSTVKQDNLALGKLRLLELLQATCTVLASPLSPGCAFGRRFACFGTLSVSISEKGFSIDGGCGRSRAQ